MNPLNLYREYSVSSQYFAPRGRERLMFLGEQIAQKHLSYRDRLVGIVGDAGSGKSSLIKGMFPGLELSNDDDVINPRKILQVRDTFDMAERESSTYHLDMRFQLGFTQMYEIADFVKSMLEKGRRLVIEHFNLLQPALGRNADIIVGIGEEIIVTHPTIFGPQADRIYDMVHSSLKYRKMAHSAEELTLLSLMDEWGIGMDKLTVSDIRNGFVLCCESPLPINFDRLGELIQEKIDQNLPISYKDENHIMVADREVPCTGPRLHVPRTSEIKNFYLVRHWVHDPKQNVYCMVGLLDVDSDKDLENQNTNYFLTRKE